MSVFSPRSFDTLGGLYQEVAARGGRNIAGDVLRAVKDPQAALGQVRNLGASLIDQGEQVLGQVKDLGASLIGAAKDPMAAGEALIGKAGDPLASITRVSGAWGNLSQYLLADLYALNPVGDGSGAYVFDEADGRVISPITEANFEAALNWQSPFENAGVESKAPNLMAMIQTGQIGTALAAIGATGFADAFGVGDQVDSLQKQAQEGAKAIEGRTGITKINSRQAFSGMPPIKLTMTMHFRALSDAKAEVVEPYQRLLRWAFPQELAADGYMTNVLKEANKSKSDALRALFPSKAPRIIGMRYGNMRYEPMVIEAISHPFDGALTSDGHPAYRAVALSLSTLTALDRNDVSKLFIR